MLIKVISTLTVVVLCLAQQHQLKKDEPVPILQYDNEGVNHDGSYKFSYKTGDGIHADGSGYLKHLEGRKEEESKAQVVQGSYSYTGPDGVLYTVNYIADENGFRAEGAHPPNNPLPSSAARGVKSQVQGAQRPIAVTPPLPPPPPPTTTPPTTIEPPVGIFPPVRVG